MKDIGERLREALLVVPLTTFKDDGVLGDAADEIERLRAAVKLLEPAAHLLGNCVEIVFPTEFFDKPLPWM